MADGHSKLISEWEDIQDVICTLQNLIEECKIPVKHRKEVMKYLFWIKSKTEQVGDLEYVAKMMSYNLKIISKLAEDNYLDRIEFDHTSENLSDMKVSIDLGRTPELMLLEQFGIDWNTLSENVLVEEIAKNLIKIIDKSSKTIKVDAFLSSIAIINEANVLPKIIAISRICTEQNESLT